VRRLAISWLSSTGSVARRGLGQSLPRIRQANPWTSWKIRTLADRWRKTVRRPSSWNQAQNLHGPVVGAKVNARTG